MSDRLLDRITSDPKVMVGKPVVRGTRLTVEHLLRELASGIQLDELLHEYPGLTEDDVRAAQLYAAEYLAKVKARARRD